MDKIRRFGWIYFAGFVAVVAIGHVPAFNDAQGRLFGLFTLDIYDDSLHLASGLWAAGAGLVVARCGAHLFSHLRPALFPRRRDGLLPRPGLPRSRHFPLRADRPPAFDRFFANLPHLVIGGFAAYVGYRLSRPRPATA